jgi:beta-glucosidase
MELTRTIAYLVIAILFGSYMSTAAVAQSGLSIPVVTGDARLDKLLSEMTIDEKIAMVHGAPEDSSTYQGQAGYVPGIPRLGIPSLRMADGPPGVLTRVPAMALTATMGVAATFSKTDARENGVVIGREDRASGIDVTLQPFINIDRDITFHRSYNDFGEDPLLTGEIGAAEIEGIQSQGIMAMAKHYIAFDSNRATDHGTYNWIVGQQEIHEIYLPPFADAVKAGVASLMCAYNQVNGQYACGNPDTLTKMLRGELGFKGFVCSDWNANHSALFMNDGLDMEMPGTMLGPRTMMAPTDFVGPGDDSTRNLKRAIQSGLISEATLTRAVGRILYEMDRFGMLDKGPKHSITEPDIAADAKVVEKTSEDAAVLLKNDKQSLPLKASDLESLVLIGPGAGQTIAVGQQGEKAVGLPQREIGTYQVLQKYFAGSPSVHVSYAIADDLTGTAIPAEYLSHNGKPGLERISIPAGANSVDAQLNFTDSNGRALPFTSKYSWQGTLTVPSAGQYQLHMQILGAYGSLLIDGQQIAGNGKMWVHGDITQAGESYVLPTTDGLDNVSRALDLSAGPHSVALSVSPDTSDTPIQIRLSWVTPEQQKENYQKAIEAARKARTAVVFVWAQGNPRFQIPGNQNQLVEDVAAANPNTIVVLNVSLPVALPWLDKVKAVLQMWWPGDEGGWSTANILLGKVSPAGRLPFTWGRSLADYPATDPAHPERRGDNPSGTGTFSEGIFVGYRWFDKQGIQPLFPFGFGLSYTRFKYSGLKVSQSGDGGLDVNFTISNVGSVPGDEVPQVYLGPPTEQPQGEQFAVRALAAFDRIHLQPGQSQAVRLHVLHRSLQYWSVAKDRWVTGLGTRRVYVGASSRNLLLSEAVSVTK